MLDEDKMVELYYSGRSKRSIAKEYNITLKVLGRIFKNKGIPVEERNSLIDMSGKIIGFWKILERDINSKASEVRWLALCLKCNTQHSVKGGLLRRGQTYQCKNCFIKSSWKGSGECSGSLLYDIKHGAKRRNIYFLLSPEFLEDLYTKQNKKCVLSGMDIWFCPVGKKYKSILGTASLDRIDSLEHYTENNVRWVHKNINQMKWDLKDEEFLYFVDLISTFNKNKKDNNRNDIIIENRKKFVSPSYRYGNLSKGYITSIKTKAKKRNIVFDLTIEDAWEIYKNQNGKCNLTGLDINLSSNIIMFDQLASLDRINSSFGYTVENCQWLHKKVNIMKLDFNQRYFIDLCKTINSYQKSKRSV